MELHWLRDQIAQLSHEEHWTRLVRVTLRDEQYRLQRILVAEVLGFAGGESDPVAVMNIWKTANQPVLERYLRRFVEFKSGSVDLALISVALNEVQKLIRSIDANSEE